jgi:hypothetical protein
MATQENTSTSTAERTKTFHQGLFKISDGIEPQEKLEQASMFLDTVQEGIDEMISIGRGDAQALWGYVHMIEAARALIDSVNVEMVKGGAA